MFHPKQYLWLLVFCVITPLGGWAQEKVFTLEQCLKYAGEQSSGIYLSIEDERASAARYREAIGRLLPNVSASTSVYLNYGRGIDPKTNTYTDVNSLRNNYNVEASLLLFDGLSSIYRMKSSREDLLAARQERIKTAQEVRMHTIEAYYNVLYTKELHRIATKHLANSTHLVEQAERMHELGMKAAADVAEMRAAMAKDRQSIAQHANQYEIALLQLKAVMNYPIDLELTILDTLTYQDVEPTLLHADDLYSLAMHRLPETLIADHRLRSSESLYRSSIGAMAPRLSLFAGFDTGFSRYMDGSEYPSFAEQLRQRRGAYVGVSLSIDLFSGLQKSARLQQSKSLRLSQQLKSDDCRRELYRSIQESILNLNASVEEYHAAVEHANYLKQVYDAALRNYEVGHLSSLELSLASARYKEATIEVAHQYTIYLLRREQLSYYADPRQ